MRLRSIVVATHPAVEPVSLGEAKAHLAVMPDQTDDDAMIVGMISAARRLIERRLGLALAPQQLRAKYDMADGQGVRPVYGYEAALTLPISRLLEGEAYPVEVDVDGVEVSSSTYTVDADEAPPVVRFSTAPLVVDYSTLTVTYWAGPAGPLAPQLRAALLLYVGHLYANREAVSTQGHSEVPMAFEALLASESVSGSY